MKTRLVSVCCLLTALAPLATLRGQTSTAQITGRISDPSDATVGGAQIRVTNMDTGVTRQTLSSPAGYYTVPLLDPGRYQVAVQASGFQSVTKTDIQLQV